MGPAELILQALTSKSARSEVPQVAGDGLRYVYKASLVGSARQFELRDDGLWWNVSGKTGVWPYGKIAAIRLSYRPVSMQSRRFRTDIENTAGDRVTLYSTTWHTIALMSPQDDDYRAFIVQLHRRLGAAGSGAVLVTGINPKIHFVGMCLVALVGAAIAALMIRGMIAGQFAAVVFLAGFAALFAWQIGGFLRRNTPRRYALDALPADLLP